MKVRDLIKRLQQCDPDAPVLAPGTFHGYRKVRQATLLTVAASPARGGGESYAEWHGEELAHPSEKPKTAVVLL